MQIRQMRILREKHGVTTAELSQYCNISRQRLSQIELGAGKTTVHMNRHIETAFSQLIAARRHNLSALESEFEACRNCLLDFADEEGAN